MTRKPKKKSLDLRLFVFATWGDIPPAVVGYCDNPDHARGFMEGFNKARELTENDPGLYESCEAELGDTALQGWATTPQSPEAGIE